MANKESAVLPLRSIAGCAMCYCVPVPEPLSKVA